MNEQYSHRNGETDPPTIEGWFWFDGKRRFTTNPNRKEILYVRDRGIVFTVSYPMPRRAARKMTVVGDLEGQWYGPIVPPWEQGA